MEDLEKEVQEDLEAGVGNLFLPPTPCPGSLLGKSAKRKLRSEIHLEPVITAVTWMS